MRRIARVRTEVRRSLSVAEVASLLAVPERLVLRYLAAQALKRRAVFPRAWLEGDEWRIPEGDVERLTGTRVQPYFSISEVAQLYGLSTKTVRSRVVVVPEGTPLDRGRPKHALGARLFFGGEWRVPECELVRLEAGAVPGLPS